MRICHVGVEIVPTAEGAFVGGLAKNVATLGKGQATRGHEPEIFTSSIRNSIQDGAEESYGRVHLVNTRGRYGSAAFAASFIMHASMQVRDAHRERPFDIIHVHSAYSSLGTIGGLLKGIDAPKVFSLYSLNFGFWPSRSCRETPSFLERSLGHRSLQAFDTTVVPSANLRSHVTDLGISEEKIVQIPPALDSTMFEPLPSQEQARRDHNLSEKSPVVLFLGNFASWKGIEVLLQAMTGVRGDFPAVVLLAAWGEPYDWSGNRRGRVLTLIERLGLGDVVRQAGILRDVRAAIRASNILVSPFQCLRRVLDYPLSILEAMACERPVISTRIGGIPELLGRGGRGVLVEPRDVYSLTSAITTLLTDPERAMEMGRRGARWTREHLTPETVSESIESLYTQLTQ